MTLSIPLTSSMRLNSGDVITVTDGHPGDCYCLLGKHELKDIGYYYDPTTDSFKSLAKVGDVIE